MTVSEERKKQPLNKRTEANLPPIESKHLRSNFVPLGEESGPGVEAAQEGVQFLNKDDYESALSSFKKALSIGLPFTYEANAHKNLGLIYLRKEQLALAVTEFIRCLEIVQRTASGTWESATHLSIIYSEAGMHEESNSLRSLAAKANTRHLIFSIEAENNIREIVRNTMRKKESRDRQTIPIGTLGDKLSECAKIMKTISKKPEYQNIKGVIGANGIIVVNESLEGIAENLYVASDALNSGIGMDGRSISRSQIASGLTRMYSDTWGYFKFPDYMKKHLTTEDLSSLSDAFVTLNNVMRLM